MKENGTSSKMLDNIGKTAGEAGIALAGAVGTGLGLNFVETKFVTPERLASNPHLPKIVHGVAFVVNGILHVVASSYSKEWWASYLKRAALGGAVYSGVKLVSDFMPESGLAGPGDTSSDKLVIITDPSSLRELPGNGGLPQIGPGNAIRRSLGNPFGAQAETKNPFRDAA